MKILNLYACLGGNRYKWNEVKEDIGDGLYLDLMNVMKDHFVVSE